MNFPIDITAAQFLAFAALALVGGITLGVGIGIKLYARYGRNYE